MRNGSRRLVHTLAAVLIALGMLAGCGGDSDDGAGTTDDTTGDTNGTSQTIKIGYSAWPGWFPLAVAEETGIFEEHGLDVELIFFTDYTASLDALAAGQVDVNAQTLNDTLFAVAAGSEQRVVVVNDNSTGNDKVVCDDSIGSVEDLAGKTVGAEEGVVTHFLLLQGLAEVGMTQDDINFVGAPTDALAASFETGDDFDCVAVFAPFTLQAMDRPNSTVLFDSGHFPGIIPDHLVATASFAEERPDDVQKLVNAWYATLAHLEADPDGSTAIMAAKAGTSVEDYLSFAEGTTLFSATDALNAFEDRPGDPTSLPEMARRINPFLVEAGLVPEEAPLDGLFMPEFTQAFVDEQG